MTHEQRVRARVAARELRLGAAWNFGPIVRAIVELHRALSGGSPDVSPTLDGQASLDWLVADLEFALVAGRLIVVKGGIPLLGIPPEFELTEREQRPAEPPPLPLIARPPPPDLLTSFEVRFVDEIGQAIGGLDVEIKAGSVREGVTTNPAGVATLDDVKSTSATVSVVSSQALHEILDPRWAKPRVGTPPSGVNTKTFAFTGDELTGISLKPVVENTIVVTPPFGKLFVELWDKTGRVRHSKQKYTISGPQQFEGETDELGRLLHDQVARGDYQLTFTVEIDAGNGEIQTDTYSSSLVVLETADPTPLVRMLGVLPRVVMARMRGMLFDTNKCFLLPSAIEAMRKIRLIYEDNNPSEVLIVGHTDTMAEPATNDPLSKERADSIKAYLEDDVDTWLKNYDLSGKKQWGAREDRLMITAMPDFRSRPPDENIVLWYQRTRDLEVDGKVGKLTRTQLIGEYMALDGVKLSEEPEFVLEIQTHGSGENFPLKDTGFELDTAAANEKEDAFDRRVELFFFDTEFKIMPAPGAPDGPEYLEWRKRSLKDDDFPVDGIGRQLTFVEFDDALFRTDSCVVLPEGERPDTETHEAITTAGLVSTVLRFNADQPKPGNKLLVAGHTDTTASPEFNQTLSEERAQCALALVVGDRESFKTLCDGRHEVADYKQILSWIDQAFPELAFGCDPGTIDNNSFTGIEPVRRFQSGYNRNKAELGATGPDLEPDGDMGPLTWGAIFDVYEFGLAQELGVELADLATLRAPLVFVDDEQRALGFSEHHPVEGIGKDKFRSQANRRVEVLFFDFGEEPDVPLAKDEPDISELYLPGFYQRVPLNPSSVTPLTRELVAARLPSRFSRGKTFPKPSSIPLLAEVLERVAASPGARLVIVGHTDSIGAEPTNQALSLARADAVKAWLLKDAAFFEKRFKEADPVSTWNWEEVQWMLYATRFEGSPHYVGAADDHQGLLTDDAVARFQLLSDDLASDGGADPATVTQLIKQYLDLLPGQLTESQIVTLGAGSTVPPLPFGVVSVPEEVPDDLEAPDRRRVEIFIVEGTILPAISSFPVPANDNTSVYFRWAAQAVVELTADPAPNFIHLVDELGRGVKQQALTLSLLQDGDEDPVAKPVGSVTTNELGLAEFDAEPGVLVVEATIDGEAFIEAVTFHPDEDCGVTVFLQKERFPFVTSE
ncbi:MAG TPA: OmpA family protein [Polyangiaceae bacterium]|nr:OmpA family protein [Polyangiaceae bacterium]